MPTIGAMLPRFRSVAQMQSDSREHSDLEEVRAKLRDAFSPSQPIMDRKAFVGRHEVLDTLIRAIEDLRLHVILFGGRGIGKTSLLHVLSQAARDARYRVIYVSCGVATSFSDVFRSAAARIPLLYCRDIAPTAPEVEAGKTFADILPVGPLSAQTVADAFARIVGADIIIALDDLDQCSSKEFRHSVGELLKNLSDKAARVQLLIGGVATDLSDLIESIPAVQRNIFAFQVRRMSPSEIRDIIKNGEEVAGICFDKAAVNGIVHAANGFPYFASLLSYYASLRALKDERTNVILDDFSGAMRDTLDQFGSRLSHRTRLQITQFIQDGQLNILGPLADIAQMSGGLFDLSDIRMQFPNENDASACVDLAEKMAQNQFLLVKQSNYALPTFHFFEESAVPYIWLISANARLQDARATDVAKSDKGAVDAISL